MRHDRVVSDRWWAYETCDGVVLHCDFFAGESLNRLAEHVADCLPVHRVQHFHE
jgi:hypothetical protein